ncbi:MAG: hypothetical protein IPM92_02530 [Saprospiraceae bacterium]|nr:hypothetical protein [Saprospiraceae bacterium]
MSVLTAAHQKLSNYFPDFWSIYLLSCGFQHIFFFPIVNDKIQLPEFVFISGLVYYALKYPIKEVFNHFSPLLKSSAALLALFWLLIHFISFIINPGIGGFLECLGIGYLILVYLIFYVGFKNLDTKILKEKITVAFANLAWAMSSIALITFLSSVFWKPNATAQIFYNYPYFGDAFRLQGFTTTPAMYVSIISLAIGFSLYDFLWRTQKKQDLIASIFFSLVSVLTLSKSVLFIGFIWIALFGFKYKIHKSMILLMGIATFLLHAIMTHFLIVDKHQIDAQEFRTTPYTSNECIYEGSDFAIYGSGYYTFKKTAWQIFKEHKWFGTGPDNYNSSVDALKEKGQYPSNLPAYDPHSTWLGSLATSGIFAFLILLGFAIYIILNLIYLWPLQDHFSFLLVLLTFIIFAESISMDIMNFRHYWVFMAVLLVYRKTGGEGAKA